MKLDATDLRYITADEFRVLRAVEAGSKNHEVVPSILIAQISGLAHSGINKIMGALAKRNLIARVQNARYDGYRLTYGGYDFLAVRALSKDESIGGVGQQVGVGKESDIYIVNSPDDEVRILKIHRLGRISFRAVKEKRDYMGKRKSASWQYLSKLSAEKEFAFMQILYDNHFPVPRPISRSRHCIVMSLIDAYPLRQIAALPSRQVPLLYGSLMRLIVRLARAGLIHGDFNEFNILVKEIKGEEEEEEEDAGEATVAERRKQQRASDVEEELAGARIGAHRTRDEQEDSSRTERIEKGNGYERIISVPSNARAEEDSDDDEASEEEADEDDKDRIHLSDGSTVEPILIDFPQMISVEHENAEMLFDRDVTCIRRFFRKRFRFAPTDAPPRFRDVVPSDRAARRAAEAKREEVRQRNEARFGEEAVGLEQWEKAHGVDLAEPAEEEEQQEKEELDDGLGKVMDLDVQVKASGFGHGSKRQKELESYMQSLRIDSTTAGAEDSEEEARDEEQEDDAEPSAETIEAPQPSLDDKEESSPSSSEDEDEETLASAPSVPSRGAALKALANGDARGVAMRVAAERARAERKASKHHGRKAHAGKGGRAHAGGKGKGDAVTNSTQF